MVWAMVKSSSIPESTCSSDIAKVQGQICRRYRENLIAKQAATEAATTTKDEALEELIEAIKTDIRYAENTVNFNDEKLKLIGWAVLHF
jgi:hypothetical protein